MINPLQLQVFRKVVECGSFSRAGTELFMTQPAVSQHIKGLEVRLGLKLLERIPGELALTQFGQVVYRFAQQITDDLHEMLVTLDGLRVRTQGSVTVGASPTGVLYYLPSILQKFQAVHPDVDVQMTSNYHLRELVGDGRLDAALVWGPISDRRLDATPLHCAPFVLVCSPNHPLAKRVMVDPEELSAYPFTVNLTHTTTRKFLEEVLRKAGVPYNVALEGSSTENIKKIAEAGLAVALIARQAVELEVTSERLHVVPVRNLKVRRDIVLIVQKGRSLSPATKQFVSFVEKSGSLFADQEIGINKATSRPKPSLHSLKQVRLPS